MRPALDTMIENGKVMAFADADSSFPAKWYPQLGKAVTTPTMLVPFRHSDRGWSDYNPMLAAAQAQVRHRLARMRAYRNVEVSEADIHLWQQCTRSSPRAWSS